MSPGTFLRETVDAHLPRATLGPAWQSDSVSFCLSTQRLARFVVALIGSLHDSGIEVR